MRHFDCAVIGTGPAGQKAAIQAAKLGKKTVVVEKSNVVGGASINTGTIPSKALRQAVLHLTGASFRGLFGESYRVKRNITVADPHLCGASMVIRHEARSSSAIISTAITSSWSGARPTSSRPTCSRSAARTTIPNA